MMMTMMPLWWRTSGALRCGCHGFAVLISVLIDMLIASDYVRSSEEAALQDISQCSYVRCVAGISVQQKSYSTVRPSI